MADEQAGLERTLSGRILGVSARTDPEGLTVWFGYQPVGGEPTMVKTVADEEGNFVFGLPEGPIKNAHAGVTVVSGSPVDLEPNGAALEPGEVVILIDDTLGADSTA